MPDPTIVDGKYAKHDVMLYTISTCIWCRHLKNKLSASNIKYQFIDIDLIPWKEKEQLRKKLRAYRLRLAFPMMFVNGEFIPNNLIDQKIGELLQEE
ncbi:MAG: glutaredoxin family protein [Candidatus Helarchaeota archaeon]